MSESLDSQSLALMETVKTDIINPTNDGVISGIVRGKIEVNTEMSPEEKQDKVFQFVAKETKVFVKNFLESQIPIMDPSNKKLLDKRLEIVDQEIS